MTNRARGQPHLPLLLLTISITLTTHIQYQRALRLGRDGAAARTGGPPHDTPSSSSVGAAAAIAASSSKGGADEDDEEAAYAAAAAAEAEAAAALDPEIAALRVCFAFRPLPAAAVAAVVVWGDGGGAGGGGGGGGGERWVLPAIGDRRLFRTTAGATVRLDGRAGRSMFDRCV